MKWRGITYKHIKAYYHIAKVRKVFSLIFQQPTDFMLKLNY